MSIVSGAAPARVEGFEVSYMAADGVERRVPLARAARVRFEDGRPVREFPSYRGQRNYPGLYWSATAGTHVGHESWLERDHAMLLDFDPQVSALVSQPLWLFWENARGKAVSHAPDYFVRRADGSVLLVDSRPEERRPARDLEKFAATERPARRSVGAMPCGASWTRWSPGTCAGWPATATRAASTPKSPGGWGSSSPPQGC
ncbi:TnsA-like heteromeric transposase endonuclease subunit [Streptomyces sp. NPDC055254]